MPKLPVDPRDLLPSRADPEHRSHRKELEKQHGYGYTEPLILAAIGIGLVWNIDNQVRKHEERKDEAERAAEERRERRRKREREQYEPRGGALVPGRDRSRDRRRGDVDRDRDDARGRDGGRRNESSRGSTSRGPRRDSSRYEDDGPLFKDDPRRLDYRYEEYRGFRDDYKNYRNDYRYEDRRAGSVRRSSRRDSF
ncbi:hypothetical protein PG996_009700 [Apiospora saccharicola]|uniref:Uncharacterized protein n=1 Tax=Apiospora saccharicola TaxID=335842 RepID=A0ABR1ULH9_9PEZI